MSEAKISFARNRRPDNSARFGRLHSTAAGDGWDGWSNTSGGESAGDARLRLLHQLHEPVDLVGHSLGGWIASLFAIFQGHRVHRLALACPAGLRVLEYPGADLFMIPPEKLPSTLAASPRLLAEMTQGEVTVDMKVARYREMTSLARIIWERSYDPKLDRWLKRASVPTLILWGEQDKVLPVQQARRWADRLACGAEISTFDGVGHLVSLESPRAVKRVASFLNGGGS
jgi:pimeloyl-ACP methyl ester carboxylesterase